MSADSTTRRVSRRWTRSSDRLEKPLTLTSVSNRADILGLAQVKLFPSAQLVAMDFSGHARFVILRHSCPIILSNTYIHVTNAGPHHNIWSQISKSPWLTRADLLIAEVSKSVMAFERQ